MFFDGIRMMGIGIECQQFFLGFSKETCADHAITFYLNFYIEEWNEVITIFWIIHC